MDPWWVRCGNCFSFASLFSSTAIYLTSCGHFVCNHCLHKSPLPKPASTGYCYDCKKVCSVVNLSQKDKLSPDITFYFKDPVSVFQKIIEVENFQKLHRDRYMEDVLKKQLMEEIVQMKASRERTEKYLPCLEQIYNYLCTKYNIKPTNQHIDYSPAQIAAFVEEMKEVKKQLYPSSISQTPDVAAMDIDNRTSSYSTPAAQGVGLVGGVQSTGKGDPNPQRAQLFRAHVQNEMRGDALRMTPPTCSNTTRPSLLLSAARTTTPTGSSKTRPSPLLSATRTTTPTGSITNKPSPLLSSSRVVAPPHPVQLLQLVPPGHISNSTAGALQPHSCTPTHAHIRQVMMSGDARQRGGIPMSGPIVPRSANMQGPRFVGMPMVVSPRQPGTPVGLPPRPPMMPMSLRMSGVGGGGGTMLSSVRRMPQMKVQQCEYYFRTYRISKQMQYHLVLYS